MPNDDDIKNLFKEAMSSIGFANESKPDENGKIHLFPCDLGSFVRQNMHKKIAECEKCPRGKYAYQYMRTFSLRKFTDLQPFIKHRVSFVFISEEKRFY